MATNSLTIEIKAEPIEISDKCAEICRNNLLGTYSVLCFFCGETLDSSGWYWSSIYFIFLKILFIYLLGGDVFKHLDKHFNFEVLEVEYLEEIYDEDEEQVQHLPEPRHPEFVEVKYAKDIVRGSNPHSTKIDFTPGNVHNKSEPNIDKSSSNDATVQKSCEKMDVLKKALDIKIEQPLSNDEEWNDNLRASTPDPNDENVAALDCKICKKVFRTMQTYKTHNRVVHAKVRTVYHCQYCKCQYFYNSDLRSHIRKKHPEIYLDNEEYDYEEAKDSENHDDNCKCKICGVTFSTAKILHVHKKMMHSKYNAISKLQCNHCKSKYTERHHLKKHYRLKHPESMPEDFRKATFSMVKCPKKAPNISNHSEEEKDRIVEKEKLNSNTIFDQNEHAKKVPLIYNETNKYQCNHCKCNYMHKHHLKKHYVLKHPDLVPEDFRNTEFSMVTSYEQIKLQCNKTSKFQCNHCKSRYTHKHHLKKHYRLKHPDFMPADFRNAKFSMVTCYSQESQISIDKIEKDLKNNENTRESIDEVEDHNKNYDYIGNPIETVVYYQCSVCFAKTQSPRQWHAHKRIHRELKPMLQCSECETLWRSSVEFQEHVKNEHRDARISEDKYKCAICSRPYRTQDSYKKHMQLHTTLEHQCDKCPKVFSSAYKLLVHKTHHDPSNRIHECDVCGHKFRSKHNLTVHFRRHTGEKPYECYECKKRFNNRSQMVHHVKRMHTHEKGYQCELCGKSFYGSYPLAEHMKRHTNYKPMKCSYCDERFFNRKMQIVHERKHTGEKPYVCQECGQAFRTYNGHADHKMLHTGIKAFACRYCGMKFAQASGRRSHEKNRHGAA